MPLEVTSSETSMKVFEHSNSKDFIADEDRKSNQVPGRGQRLRLALNDFANNTTFHGVRNVTDGSIHILRRCLWLLFFLFLVGLLLWFAVDRFVIYYQFHATTHVAMKTEQPMKFPAITICNLNNYRRSYVEQNSTAAEALKQIFQDPFVNDANQTFTDPALISWAKATSTYNFIEAAGHNISMFVNCAFQRRTFDCATQLQRVMTSLGHCFTYVTSGKVERTGADFGLHLRIDIERNESFFGPSSSSGIKVLLHAPEVEPLIDELGFYVSPGTETFVSVRKFELISLPRPYKHSRCEDMSIFANPLGYHQNYSMQACRAECRRNFTVSSCSCRLPYMKGDLSEPFCTFYQYETCVKEAIEEYERNDTYYDACGCVHPCKITEYDGILSSSYFPAPHIMEEMEKRHPGMDESAIRKSHIELKIFYEELDYELIEQVPAYTLASLGGDIGGLMGLCIGGSILSIIELLELLPVVCYHAAKKPQRVGRRKSF